MFYKPAVYVCVQFRRMRSYSVTSLKWFSGSTSTGLSRNSYSSVSVVYPSTKSLQVSLNCYRPQRSWGKVIFSQASVILFIGGVCLSTCWDTTTSGTRHPHRSSRHPLPRARHNPGPGTPPGAGTPPPQQQASPGAGTPLHRRACWEIRSTTGGTHPTGMHSCLT